MKPVRCKSNISFDDKCPNILFYFDKTKKINYLLDIDENKYLQEFYCKKCRAYHYYLVSDLKKIELSSDQIERIQKIKKRAKRKKLSIHR